MKTITGVGPVLVTGGAGFIGQYLVRSLRQRGEHVIAVDNLSTSPWGDPCADVEVRDVLSLSGHELNGIRCVVHLANRKIVPTSFHDPNQFVHNVSVDRHVLGLIAEARPAVAVLASSCEVYGAQPHALAEDTPLRPRSPYAVGKVTMELLADVYRSLVPTKLCVARLFNVYGPGEGIDAVVPRFVQEALSRRSLVIEGSGSQCRDFTYVDDVVDAIVGLMELGEPPPVVNIASGLSYSVRDIARRVASAVGGVALLTAPPRPNEIVAFVSDTTVLRRVLPQWQPSVDLDEGIARCLQWARAQMVGVAQRA